MANIENDAFSFISRRTGAARSPPTLRARATRSPRSMRTANALSGAAIVFRRRFADRRERLSGAEDPGGGRGKFFERVRAVAFGRVDDAPYSGAFPEPFGDASGRRIFGKLCGCFHTAAGTITNIAVHDVADVDVAFKPKIVPPAPLQLEETAFRPADANWFFDFPTSASETINMFERSGLYATSTTFDGVVAVTPQVMEDLLSVTGPITLPGARRSRSPLHIGQPCDADPEDRAGGPGTRENAVRRRQCHISESDHRAALSGDLPAARVIHRRAKTTDPRAGAQLDLQ